jgi:hypothetical protein
MYISVVFSVTAPQWARASSFTRFLDHTQRHTTIGRTPLDEWSARRRNRCLTTHNTYNRQISMPPVGFEPKISADERPQTYALDRETTGTGIDLSRWTKFCSFLRGVLYSKHRFEYDRTVSLYRVIHIEGNIVVYRGLSRHSGSTRFLTVFRLWHVVWAGNPPRSHKMHTIPQYAQHDAAAVWQWRTCGKLWLPQHAT